LRTTSECRDKEHVFDFLTVEDRSLNQSTNDWIACPEQPCPNCYAQDPEANPDLWLDELRAPNNNQIAQIQERQRQNA
jgi:hypothetical protein